MRLVATLGMLALSSVTSLAHATPSARLVYTRSEDAASCADEAALRKAVAARFGYDPFFAWARQTILLQIWRESGRYIARVQLVDERGVATGTREIRSDDDGCPEVFGAAALAISIALDASSAQATPPPPAPETPTPTAIEPNPAPAEAPAPTPEPAADTRPPEPPSSRSETARPGGPFRVGLGTRAAALIGPNVAPGISLFGSYRDASFSLDVELDADTYLPANATLPESSPPTAHLASALFVVAMAPCAHYGRAFACGLGEAGWLQAWGWGVEEPASSGAPFVALGARVGAEWPIGSRLFVRVHADGLANLERANLVLDGQIPWQVPPAGGVLGLGVGARLP